MNTRTAAVTAALGVALLVAGCGQGDTPAEGASAPAVEKSAPVTPEPVPTPTEISLEDAGAQYLALAEPYNATLPAVKDAFTANDLPAVRVTSGQLAAAGRAFADGLVAAEWPEAVQATVDAVVAEVAAEIPVYLAIAASTEDQETIDLTYTLPPQQGNAQKLRILLGLPDIPVS